MAKQVHFPLDPTCIQPWAIYFLTPFKCGIFGVACEAIPRQIFYLIDEGMSIGEGANSIISYLHHFSQPHGLGEKTTHLHADNCTGQNKNNYVLHYFMWWTLVGLSPLNHSIILLVVHTKFAPDWCFDLFKQHFRLTKVGGIDDIAGIVDR